jgi:hypothetical protein
MRMEAMMLSPAVESTCVTAASLKSVISNAFRPAEGTPF